MKRRKAKTIPVDDKFYTWLHILFKNTFRISWFWAFLFQQDSIISIAYPFFVIIFLSFDRWTYRAKYKVLRIIGSFSWKISPHRYRSRFWLTGIISRPFRIGVVQKSVQIECHFNWICYWVPKITIISCPPMLEFLT